MRTAIRRMKKKVSREQAQRKIKCWIVSNNVNFRIDVYSQVWFREHKKDIYIWLESEGIDQYNNYSDFINLFTEERLAYFKLRWSQYAG